MNTPALMKCEVGFFSQVEEREAYYNMEIEKILRNVRKLSRENHNKKTTLDLLQSVERKLRRSKGSQG